MEELRTKAQKVMDILEKPEVIAALRQDKAQNLQYLKENYKVYYTHLINNTKSFLTNNFKNIVH